MTDELTKLVQQRDALQAQINSMQVEYDSERATVQGEIAAARASADSVAAAMRDAFSAASAAYAAEEGAAAAAMASQGRALLAQCQALNAQVAQLGQQLSQQREALQEARSQLRDLNERIKAKRKEVQEQRKAALESRRSAALERIVIDGFETARGISGQVVRQLLADLPPKLLEQIESVTYVDTFGPGWAAGLTSAKPKVPEKGKITIYDLFEFENRSTNYAETVNHEAGHVLFERLTSSKQRFEWGNIFNDTLREGRGFVSLYAATSLREDFAESFMYYRLYSGKLRSDQELKYRFIDKLYKEISR